MESKQRNAHDAAGSRAALPCLPTPRPCTEPPYLHQLTVKGGCLNRHLFRRLAAPVLSAASLPRPAAQAYRRRSSNSAHLFRNAAIPQVPFRRHLRRRCCPSGRRLPRQQHPDLEKIDGEGGAQHGDAGGAQKRGRALRSSTAVRPLFPSSCPRRRLDHSAVPDRDSESGDAGEGGPLGEPPPGRADGRGRELARSGGQDEQIAEDASYEASEPRLGPGRRGRQRETERCATEREIRPVLNPLFFSKTSVTCRADRDRWYGTAISFCSARSIRGKDGSLLVPSPSGGSVPREAAMKACSACASAARGPRSTRKTQSQHPRADQLPVGTLDRSAVTAPTSNSAKYLHILRGCFNLCFTSTSSPSGRCAARDHTCYNKGLKQHAFEPFFAKKQR